MRGNTKFKIRSEVMESVEMWCWRMMEKFSWIDHVKNEEMLRLA